MTDPAAANLRSAQASDAEAIANLFTDEGYPAGSSDILVRLAPGHLEREVADENGDILGALTERRHDDPRAREPEVEVRAEAALFHMFA